MDNKRFFSCRNKKWWIMILGGLANSFVYAFSCSAFSVAPDIFFVLLGAIPVVFVLLIWLLSQTSLKRFFVTTFILIISYIFIGFPMFSYFFHLFWEMRYPGEVISGEGLAEISFTFLYIIMSIVAWIVALVLTIRCKIRRQLKEGSD